MKKDSKKNEPHMLTMAPLETWARLLWENGGVSRPYMRKVARILVVSLMTLPLRLAEKVKYGKALERTRIEKPPVFIVGFARSGTTHLHNLMTTNPEFGAVSNFQAYMPTVFLSGGGFLKKELSKKMEPTRPMDNVRLSADTPQEEEVAIANSCHVSFMHHFSFPQKLREYFEKYAMMDGISDEDLKTWDGVFTEIAKKATFDNGGLRLVMKSPTNTGRISHLLRLFPDAKFIHIVRNPYEVFQSMMHLYRKMIPLYQLQSVDIEAMADDVFHIYKAAMGRYMEERSLIPEGNFTEVRFENLEKEPLAELERVYSDLSLPGWETAMPHAREYLGSISGYKKNELSMKRSDTERVDREFRFTLDEWGYEAPDGLKVLP
ncbi:MAG: sulfotransferase family protein [Thermodesulfobacteriota bacterium]